MLRHILIAASAAALLTVGGIAATQEADTNAARERADIDEHAEEALAEFFDTVEGGRPCSTRPRATRPFASPRPDSASRAPVARA